MSDTPTTLLSAERLTEIRAQLNVPRARNSYVTDYGVAADVVEELIDHIDAREAAFTKALKGLLPPAADKLAGYDAPIVKEMSRMYDELIHRAAASLGIDLTK